MTNGQINAVSVQSVIPFDPQEQAGSVAATVNGEQKNGGNFDGLLRGIQNHTHAKITSGNGQAEQTQSLNGTDQLAGAIVIEQQIVDLLAVLQTPPESTQAAGSSTLPKNPESADLADTGKKGDEPSNIASLMALAGYLQPGRMPEIKIAVAGLQNGATTSEQPAEDTLMQPVPVNATARGTEVVLNAVEGHIPKDMGEKAASDQPAIVSVEPVEGLVKQFATAADLSASVTQPKKPEQTTLLAVLPEKTPNKQKITVSTAPTDNHLQNASSAAERSGVTTVTVNKIQMEHPIAEQALYVATKANLLSPAVPAVVLPEVAAKPAEADIPEISSAEARQKALTVPQNEVTTVPTMKKQPEQMAAKPAVAEMVAAQQVASVAALAGIRTAEQALETHSARQQVALEQHAENNRKESTQSSVKEMAEAFKTTASTAESMSNLDVSLGSDGNQGQSDLASNNQMFDQQIRAHAGSGQQNISSPSAKPVFPELARQDIPEQQIMQQMKERLVQHDVKPGNQQITLTLSPDSLGELKMNLNLQGQKLSVEIITENRAVRDVIVQHTDALKESLARQNITMESFDVTTGGKGSGNTGQNQHAWRELAKQQQQQQFLTSARGYLTAQADLPSGHAVYRKQHGQSMLDIHY